MQIYLADHNKEGKIQSIHLLHVSSPNKSIVKYSTKKATLYLCKEGNNLKEQLEKTSAF